MRVTILQLCVDGFGSGFPSRVSPLSRFENPGHIFGAKRAAPICVVLTGELLHDYREIIRDHADEAINETLDILPLVVGRPVFRPVHWGSICLDECSISH